ncbi:MAG: EAL domain-containing protein [Myxococcota bacterium]|nr:EAL domain-containing protein [Myxococcota bacterium]
MNSVLVADDENAFARAVGRVLTSAGFDVTTVDSGDAAADAVAGRSFEVILSDIEMPGMSGVELLGLVREHDLDVPVILMTGAPSLETALEAIALGALQYIVKPVANDVLVAAVERACRLHRMGRMKRDALRLIGEGGQQAGDRAGLQSCFDRALECMWLDFQPIADYRLRRIFGYEALLRSNEPALPHPGAVLSAAERLGRLPELGQRVRDLSARAFERAPDGVLLFVNLHTRDLLDPHLYDAQSPLTHIAARVVLELTERAAIDDIPDARSRVARLRQLGFRIAIDDLGAGYAGLSSFAALEPEVVKLDMSLVRDVQRSPIRQRLIGSMTSLCKDMGMRVVAEGIESIEECETVFDLGCGLLQGYYFAKPGRPFPHVEGFR